MSANISAAGLGGALFLLAAPALAAADSAPHDPNSPPAQPYTLYVSRCEPGTAPVRGKDAIYCDGVPTGRFVEVDAIPAGYTGRVIVIDEDRAGYQELGW